jgi:hypothetical protein
LLLLADVAFVWKNLLLLNRSFPFWGVLLKLFGCAPWKTESSFSPSPARKLALKSTSPSSESLHVTNLSSFFQLFNDAGLAAARSLVSDKPPIPAWQEVGGKPSFADVLRAPPPITGANAVPLGSSRPRRPPVTPVCRGTGPVRGAAKHGGLYSRSAFAPVPGTDEFGRRGTRSAYDSRPEFANARNHGVSVFDRIIFPRRIGAGHPQLLVLSLNLARQLMGKFIVFVILNVPVVLVKLVVPLGWIWILI